MPQRQKLLGKILSVKKSRFQVQFTCHLTVRLQQVRPLLLLVSSPLELLEQTPWAVWLIHHRNLSFTVLEAGKSKVKAPADSVSCESPIPVSQTTVFCYNITWWKRQMSSPGSPFKKDTNPNHLITSQRFQLQILPHLESRFHILTARAAGREGRGYRHLGHSTGPQLSHL